MSRFIIFCRLLLFAVEDSERNDGSPEKPFYMSKPLRKLLGKKNKKRESDSDWGTGSFHLPRSINSVVSVDLWINPRDINISGILFDFYLLFDFTFWEVFIISQWNQQPFLFFRLYDSWTSHSNLFPVRAPALQQRACYLIECLN